MNELNEKIMDTLTKNDCYVHDSDGAIFFEETKLAANEIEKLVLQDRIENFNYILDNCNLSDTDRIKIKSITEELTNQLNLIK